MLPLGIGGMILSAAFARSPWNFSIRKHKRLNAERSSLTKQLIQAKNALHSGDVRVAPAVRDLENALASLISKEAGGAKIRSRVQWIEEGEKSMRFFFRLEQKRADKIFFETLVDDAGIERSSQSDLESILVNFYRCLVSEDSIDMQIQTGIIDDLEFSLTDLEREQCEGLFSKEELHSALQDLQTGKSPGSDGLPTEFYLVFLGFTW